LCIDNGQESRDVLAEVLAGYRIVFACNAFEGIRELHKGMFDAYLLEYSLPDWSGVQLCREIRKADPRVPILYCTGAARAEDRELAFKAGASAYLCKPIDPPRLLGQLRVLLELAERESTRARLEAQRAIQEDLARRTADVFKRTGISTQLACRAIERGAKVKAFHAFAVCGGTRAHFTRWWPVAFANAWASFEQQREHYTSRVESHECESTALDLYRPH
jgi:CheY-like chemotaxis protein